MCVNEECRGRSFINGDGCNQLVAGFIINSPGINEDAEVRFEGLLVGLIDCGIRRLVRGEVYGCDLSTGGESEQSNLFCVNSPSLRLLTNQANSTLAILQWTFPCFAATFYSGFGFKTESAGTTACLFPGGFTQSVV